MENTWEQYKKIYTGISVPSETVDANWEKISERLPAQDLVKFPPIARYGFAFLGIVLLLTIGLINASQEAKPGDTLYSVKEFTKNVTSKVLKEPTPTLQKPGGAVIKKPKATLTITQTPTPTPVPEVKGARTEVKIQPKINEQKVVPPQTGQAVQNSGNTGDTQKNEEKHENQGNNQKNNQGNNNDKPKNENAESHGNNENKGKNK